MKITHDSVYGCWLLPNVGADSHLQYRAIWQAYYGVKLPPKVELDHLCRRPRCAYPLHLDPVTYSENQSRKRSFHRKHRIERCASGHRLTDGTVIWTPEGGLVCTLCPRLAPDV